MNSVFQRVFGYFLCLGFVISLTIFPISANPVYTQNSNSLPVTTEIRGVWLTNVASGVFYIPWGIDRAINQLANLNFNTIYPVVWNRGYTFYKSPLAKKITGADSQPFTRSDIIGSGPAETSLRTEKILPAAYLPTNNDGSNIPALTKIKILGGGGPPGPILTAENIF